MQQYYFENIEIFFYWNIACYIQLKETPKVCNIVQKYYKFLWILSRSQTILFVHFPILSFLAYWVKNHKCILTDFHASKIPININNNNIKSSFTMVRYEHYKTTVYANNCGPFFGGGIIFTTFKRPSGRSPLTNSVRFFRALKIHTIKSNQFYFLF
jgi:hypothetical protein